MSKSLLKKIDTFSHTLGHIEMALCCLFLVSMVVIVGVSVFLRYVLNSPLVAGMNLAALLLVWLSFFGASFVYRENGHIAIEFVVNFFSVQVRRFLMLAVYMVIFLTLVITVVQSGNLATIQWQQQIVALGIPRSFLSLPIIITGILMTLTTLQHMAVEILSPLEPQDS